MSNVQNIDIRFTDDYESLVMASPVIVADNPSYLSKMFTFSSSILCQFNNMKRRDFLEQWGLSSLKLKLGFLEGEFTPQDPDRAAAWELYIELLTRITTQSLASDDGDEKTALDSVHEIFPLTREILKRHGSGSIEFAKLAIPVLNQIIRPFTAKWHRLSLSGEFKNPISCQEFRTELSVLQPLLLDYTRALAAMAEVEDLTELEGMGN
jgi:hypothetical protein